jgi:hypothetical protein
MCRGYERKLELAGTQRLLVVRSRAVPCFVQDAGFLLTSIGPESTGVPGAAIWLAIGEFSTDDAHLGPRIMVVVGTELTAQSLAAGVAVTLSIPATVVGTLPEAIRGRVISFADSNRDVLLEYWGGELDTRSAIGRLERVRSR